MFCDSLPPGSKHCPTQTAVTPQTKQLRKHGWVECHLWVFFVPMLVLEWTNQQAPILCPPPSSTLLYPDISGNILEVSVHIVLVEYNLVLRKCSKDTQRQTVEISETVATPEQGAKAGMWGFKAQHGDPRKMLSMEAP